MTDILNQFREDDLPPSHVDIARAVRSGRQRRRAHAGLVAGGVVVVLAAGAATAPVWLSAVPGRGGSSAAATCAGPLPAYTRGTAWQTFDPLTYEIDASAVTGYRVSSYSTGRYFQVMELTNPARTRWVTVTLYATEGVPHFRVTDPPGPLNPAAGEPAEPVSGAPAYWLPDQDVPDQNLPGSGLGLAWQWTLGGWALVAARAVDPTSATGATAGDRTELRAIATQVASQLALGSGTAVTSPFSMPVPECTRVDSTSLMFGTKDDDTPFARFGLGFATAGQTEPSNPLLIPGDSGPAITVDADTGATPEDKPGSTTSEVDNYPALDQGNFLVVYGPVAVEISTGPATVDSRALYRSVQLHPGATADPATWGPPIG